MRPLDRRETIRASFIPSHQRGEESNGREPYRGSLLAEISRNAQEQHEASPMEGAEDTQPQLMQKRFGTKEGDAIESEVQIIQTPELRL